MDWFKRMPAAIGAIGVVALVALTVSATAIAGTTISTRSFSGTVQGPSGAPGPNTIDFKAKVKTTKRHHHPKKVKVTQVKSGMVFGKLPLLCQTHPNVLLTFTLGFPIPVRDSHFLTGSTPGVHHDKVSRLEGNFTNKGKKASGTIRVTGFDNTDDGGTSSGCDSHTDHWTAHT